MYKWFKEKSKRNKYLPSSLSLFVVTFIMAISRSGGVGNYFRNILEITFGSFLMTCLISIIFFTSLEEGKKHEVLYFIGFVWALIAFMGEFGDIWKF